MRQTSDIRHFANHLHNRRTRGREGIGRVTTPFSRWVPKTDANFSLRRLLPELNARVKLNSSLSWHATDH